MNPANLAMMRSRGRQGDPSCQPMLRLWFKDHPARGLHLCLTAKPQDLIAVACSHIHTIPWRSGLFKESIGVISPELSRSFCFKHWRTHWVDCSTQQRNQWVKSVSLRPLNEMWYFNNSALCQCWLLLWQSTNSLFLNVKKNYLVFTSSMEHYTWRAAN